MSASINNNEQQPSLVDGVVTIIRRWPFFLVPFIIITAVFVVIGLQKHQSYEYVSVYKIGKLEKDSPLESQNSIALTIEAIIIPNLLQTLNQSGIEGATVLSDLKVDLPRSTNLVLLKSYGDKSSEPKIRAVHKEILSHLEDDQDNQLARQKGVVEKKLEAVRGAIDKIDPQLTPDVYANVREKELSLANSLLELKKGEVVVVARSNPRSGGLTKSRIIILGVLVALFSALFIVFFAEFCFHVRERFQDQKSNFGV